MKIAIFGAGAIGSYLAVRLSQAGAQVSLIARGAQLDAIRKDGLTLKSGEESTSIRPAACTAYPEEVGVQDYVFVSLKAHMMLPAARHIATLLEPDTALVTAMNGIPYWYFYGIDSPWRDRPIRSLDPHGELLSLLPPRHGQVYLRHGRLPVADSWRRE